MSLSEFLTYRELIDRFANMAKTHKNCLTADS